jgi:hypothetical protein
MDEAARILGVKYVQAPAADVKQGLIQAGLSPSVADGFEEMSEAFNSGRIGATVKRDAANSTPTRLEDFSPSFAAALSS